MKKIKREDYYPLDRDLQYSKGYNKSGQLIWHLHFANDPDEGVRYFFSTYEYDSKGNNIKAYTEIKKEGEKHWKVSSVSFFKYSENKIISETSYFANYLNTREITIIDNYLIVPFPLYPDYTNYQINNPYSKKKITYYNDGDIRSEKIQTFNKNQKKIRKYKKKYEYDEKYLINITEKENGDIIYEETNKYKYGYDEIQLLIEKEIWVNEDYEHYNSVITYEYDREDFLIKTVEEHREYDSEGYFTTTKFFENNKIIKEEYDNSDSSSKIENFYDSDGQLNQFIYSKTEYYPTFSGSEIIYEARIIREEDIIRISLNFPKPEKFDVEFLLEKFIEIPNEFYSIEILSEIPHSIDNEGNVLWFDYKLENNNLDILISYFHGHIEEIALINPESKEILKKKIFLNHYVQDRNKNSLIKSSTGLEIFKNLETNKLFDISYEYFE